MSWNTVGPLLVLLLGGAGITGLATSYVQFTKPARLRRSMEHLAAGRDTLPERSPKRAELEQSLEKVAGKLAAAVTPPPKPAKATPKVLGKSLTRRRSRRRGRHEEVFLLASFLATATAAIILAVSSPGALGARRTTVNGESLTDEQLCELLDLPCVIDGVVTERYAPWMLLLGAVAGAVVGVVLLLAYGLLVRRKRRQAAT